MEVRERTQATRAGAVRHAQRGRSSTRRPRPFTGGGPEGNEQLTASIGVILLILLAVLGITILRIGQLISVHLFVGLLLIGPIGMKMASTGYRFARYYTHDRAYRRKGPPSTPLRLIAPLVVLTTVIVFASGVALLFQGPSGRGTLSLIHKVSFFAWLAVTAVHVLCHLPRMPASLRAVRRSPQTPGFSPGGAGRWIALIGPLVGGLVLALVLVPDCAPWTAHAAFAHHHHG
jgi:hypothetical protein